MTDTVPVIVTIDAIDKCHGCGTLLAQAVVSLSIAGIEQRLLGVQIRRDGAQLKVLAPAFRHWRRGVWLPAIEWDDTQISEAIAAELLEAYHNMPPALSPMSSVGEETPPPNTTMEASR
jgi:hypothetical protein